MRGLLPGTLAAAIALTGATTTSAAAPGDYRPAFRPDQLKGPPAGAPNEVLVLGTVHLSGLGDGFRAAQLSPLLDRLARWQPTAIATESLSGLQCDSLRRYPARYADTVESYCPDTGPAAAATGLDVPAATAEAERLLAAWPARPTARQRRHLAAILLAGGGASLRFGPVAPPAHRGTARGRRADGGPRNNARHAGGPAQRELLDRRGAGGAARP
ncbi:hypothetical protein [Sphingomonas sp.]|uniref:hypothetical protein n=1 Tax=Sphingomonas sp. TaxID=28214 RepID=UPI00345DE173